MFRRTGVEAVRSQAGQAYLEVLVATVILTLAITPFLAVYVQSTRGVAQENNREGAAAVAQSVMEQVIAGDTPAAQPPGSIYTVVWTRTAVSGRTGFYRYTVTASWTGRAGAQSYALTTYARR